MIIEKALEYCRTALKNVSRSFALTIPLVEKNILVPILVGYLEARILDNFEDEKTENPIEKKTRMEYLDKIMSVISNSNQEKSSRSIEEIKEMAVKSISNPHYLDLTLNIDKVMLVHSSLGLKEKNAITRWFSEMSFGMKKYLDTRIDTFEQLDDYCYYVGGTVGGLVTQLVIQSSKQVTEQQIKIMQNNKRDFGLFLQKINITRDFREDMKRNEKIFWPHNSFLEHNITPEKALDPKYKEESMHILQQMTENSRKHIFSTCEYLSAVPEDFTGFKKASAINFLMGVETLNKMEKNPDVFYSDDPVKINKETKNRILSDPLKELERVAV